MSFRSWSLFMRPIVDYLRVGIVRRYLGDRADLRLVHDYRVALDMGAAGGVADGSRVEHLLGVIPRDGAGDYLRARIFAV